MALTLANKITLFRILAVPFFIGCLIYYDPGRDALRFWALGVFLFAVVSDVIDGHIARAWHQKTRAGALLDPLADKLLLLSGVLVLSLTASRWPVSLPLWLVVAVVSREVILLIGALLIFVMQGSLNVSASPLGKASTFFQVLAVISILLQWSLPWLWGLVLIFTFLSGVDYIRKGIKVLNHPASARMGGEGT